VADFTDAQLFVHSAEGGFQADPRDRGNWTSGKIGQGELAGTNYVISAMFLSQHRARPVTRREMEELTYAQAVDIYRASFWQPLQLDLLTDQQLALLLYDCAVNQGTGTARAALRHAVRHAGGKVTRTQTTRELIAEANRLDAAQLHALTWEYRRDKYPHPSPFYKGWMRRLDRLRRR